MSSGEEQAKQPKKMKRENISWEDRVKRNQEEARKRRSERLKRVKVLYV